MSTYAKHNKTPYHYPFQTGTGARDGIRFHQPREQWERNRPRAGDPCVEVCSSRDSRRVVSNIKAEKSKRVSDPGLERLFQQFEGPTR